MMPPLLAPLCPPLRDGTPVVMPVDYLYRKYLHICVQEYDIIDTGDASGVRGQSPRERQSFLNNLP
jgi:hypothetical protein